MRLFVDNLTNVDFSFLHPSRGLVGETWLASVELIGELDEQGMVVDFGVIKRMLRHWLDEQIDHRLLIAAESPHLTRLDTLDEQYHLQWSYSQQELYSQCPADAITQIDSDVITPESVAQWCIKKLSPQFPESVKELKLTFTPEHIEGPYYHYSHGLKKHDGNCQRIAHGHRSRIYIWRNDQLSEKDMQAWADKWEDIYIGTESDLTPAKHSANTAFKYQAPQGEFQLELPTNQCYLIPCDSTIELIAQHIADTLKRENPQDSFKVKAFEGLAKGAIAEA